MASSGKKTRAPSLAAQRNPRKVNKVNLHAEQNGELSVVGIGASAGGLRAPHGLLILSHRPDLLRCSVEVKSYLGNGKGFNVEVSYEHEDS
jgi:hypothetical protein